MAICLICEKEFKPTSKINTVCRDALCKKKHKYKREHEKRKIKGLKRYSDDPNHSIEKLTKTCIYCGNEFHTHKFDLDSCRAKKCVCKRNVMMKKKRISKMSESEILAYKDKRKTYNGTGEKSAISSLSVCYIAKCPMCKKMHRIRLEYGSIIEGTIYKYCELCKRRVEKVDENTMMFGYIPELEEMQYEPVRA